MGSIERVFFHELGHFVARKINHVHYGGPDVTSIELFPCPRQQEELCGGLELVISVGHEPGRQIPTDRLSSYLLSILYGCVFQSYRAWDPIDACLTNHGEEDSVKFDQVLRYHGFRNHNTALRSLILQHLKELKEARSLDAFLQLPVKNYLLETGPNRFSVKLPELCADTQALIETHHPLYQALEQAFSTILY